MSRCLRLQVVGNSDYQESWAHRWSFFQEIEQGRALSQVHLELYQMLVEMQHT